jgi:acetoin utilization deacetylase AcuC-like enzyme
MVVDCDLHQGNGTAYIFRDDPDVFTFSIHQENLYPVKQRSDLDLGLPDFCDGERYLDALRTHLPDAMDRHRPDFVAYVAGADPYAGDMLGSLSLTLEEVRARDALVLGECSARDVPATVVLGGGYCRRVEDTVRVHLQAARAVAMLAGAQP